MFVLNGCITSTTPAPLPKTTLKGKVVVPEGAVKGKRVTGEALAEATVNIVNPKTDNVIATTTTDVNGNYNVDVTAGGPYIVEAGKGNVKVLDVSPIIQEGETKDLGTADATSTAQALIFMYLVEAGSDPSQIDIDAIPNLSGFSQLVNQIETILEAGGDPTTNTQVNNVINNIVSPQPATGGGGGGGEVPAQVKYKVVVMSENGTVKGTGEYKKGDTVILTATPNEGYEFVNWTDSNENVVSTDNPYTFTMGVANVTLTANFREKESPVTKYTLTLNGEGLSSDPEAGEIDASTKVTITVTPPDGKQITTFTVNDEDKKNELINNTFSFEITVDTTVAVTYEGVPVPSTYTFSYTVPSDIVDGEEKTVDVTFATDVLGDYGYDKVRFTFAATGPENATVTFKVKDTAGVKYTFINKGVWGPADGFDLPADYSATTSWKLTFSQAGTYTITFNLVEATTNQVIAGITKSETVIVKPALPEKSTYQIIFEDLKNEYPIRDLVVVSGDQDAINGAVEQKILDLVLVPIVVTLKTNVKGKSGYDAVRIQPVNAGNHIQLWAKDTNDNWHDINAVGWGDLGGFELPVEYKAATEVYFLSDKSGEYELTVQLVDINNDNKEIAKASKKVYVVATNEEELENAIYKAEGGVVLLGSNFASKKELTLKNSVTLKSRVKHGAVFNKTVNIDTIGVVIEDVRFVAGDGHSIIIDKIDNIKIEGCEFDAKNRFMTEPHINAIQLVNKCSNITIDNCSFRNGYYVTINGYADNLTVQNCTIENCKSGINLQGGENLRVINTDISVIAKGVDNDTYCVRFASSSDSSGNNLTVSGGKYKVDKNGLVADETKAFHSAIIIRSGASGDLNASGLHIIGEVVNLSKTNLDACGNKWGIAGQTEPEDDQLKGNTKKIIVE